MWTNCINSIPTSFSGEVLVDGCCQFKLLWNSTLPCAYTYALYLKMCARRKRMLCFTQYGRRFLWYDYFSNKIWAACRCRHELQIWNVNGNYLSNSKMKTEAHEFGFNFANLCLVRKCLCANLCVISDSSIFLHLSLWTIFLGREKVSFRNMHMPQFEECTYLTCLC